MPAEVAHHIPRGARAPPLRAGSPQHAVPMLMVVLVGVLFGGITLRFGT